MIPAGKVTDVVTTQVFFYDNRDKLYYDVLMTHPYKCFNKHHMTIDRVGNIACNHKKCDVVIKTNGREVYND